jgi:hypothetical protein
MGKNPQDFTRDLRQKLLQHFPKEYHVPHITATLRFELKVRQKLRDLIAKARGEVLGIPGLAHLRGIGRCGEAFR